MSASYSFYNELGESRSYYPSEYRTSTNSDRPYGYRSTNTSSRSANNVPLNERRADGLPQLLHPERVDSLKVDAQQARATQVNFTAKMGVCLLRSRSLEIYRVLTIDLRNKELNTPKGIEIPTTVIRDRPDGLTIKNGRINAEGLHHLQTTLIGKHTQEYSRSTREPIHGVHTVKFVNCDISDIYPSLRKTFASKDSALRCLKIKDSWIDFDQLGEALTFNQSLNCLHIKRSPHRDVNVERRSLVPASTATSGRRMDSDPSRRLVSYLSRMPVNLQRIDLIGLEMTNDAQSLDNLIDVIVRDGIEIVDVSCNHFQFISKRAGERLKESRIRDLDISSAYTSPGATALVRTVLDNLKESKIVRLGIAQDILPGRESVPLKRCSTSTNNDSETRNSPLSFILGSIRGSKVLTLDISGVVSERHLSITIDEVKGKWVEDALTDVVRLEVRNFPVKVVQNIIIATSSATKSVKLRALNMSRVGLKLAEKDTARDLGKFLSQMVDVNLMHSDFTEDSLMVMLRYLLTPVMVRINVITRSTISLSDSHLDELVGMIKEARSLRYFMIRLSDPTQQNIINQLMNPESVCSRLVTVEPKLEKILKSIWSDKALTGEQNRYLDNAIESYTHTLQE